MAETALIRRLTACHNSKRLLSKLFSRSLVTGSGNNETGPLSPTAAAPNDTTMRTRNLQKSGGSVSSSTGKMTVLVPNDTNRVRRQQLGTPSSMLLSTTATAVASASATTTTTTTTSSTSTTTTTIASTTTPELTAARAATGAAPLTPLNWNFAAAATRRAATTPGMTTSHAALSHPTGGAITAAALGAAVSAVSYTTTANLSTSATVAAPPQRGAKGAPTSSSSSCPFSAIRTVVTNSSTDKNSATGSSAQPLSMKELPGPKGWPFLGTFPEFLRKENRGCIHKVQLKFHKKYGRMFKLNFGPHTNVCLADPNLVEEFMRMEGKHPNRPPYQSWVLYKELRKKETGLMTAADEKWHKYRSTIAPRLLRPQMAAGYTDKLSNIVYDLTDRIQNIRNKEDHTVPMLQNELYKWATESVGSVLFGRRLGCLQDNMPQNIQDLINAVGVMFVTGHQMAVGANIHQFLNTSIWQKHVSASDIIYGLAQEFIDQRLEEISHDRSGVSSGAADLLTYLLSNPSFSIAEIYSNMAELFLAGLDTASNSLGFAIYLLAKYPKVQEKLQEEISRTLQGELCTSTHLANMPYLKAVVKESMRLYPVIPMGARITTEDIVLDGYLIPKGTCLMINNYVMSRDEMYFPQANEFIPERWFRSDTRKFHPFAVIPFGHGSRSCIGRRVAELELYLAITNICQNFWLSLQEGFEVEPFLRTVLTVGEHFPIQFVNR